MIGSAFRREIITVLTACVRMTSFKSVAYHRMSQYLPCVGIHLLP
jgi:hypothetical protein